MLPRTLFLNCLVAAVFAIPQKNSDGIAIPLESNHQYVRSNGVVNVESVRALPSKVLRKYSRGFSAFEKNTGSPHRLAANLKIPIEKRASEPLTDFEEGLWYGSATIGTPPQEFKMIYDTGSSDVFVPSVSCDSTCQGHTLWDPSKSSTSQDINETYTLDFGSGGDSVNGTIFTDTLTVAGLKATGQAIGASTQYSSEFQIDNNPADGLVGMAFPSLSGFGKSPFFSNLINQTNIFPKFGVKLADNGSELFLGGVNHALFRGAFTTIPVIQDAFWEVNLTAVGLNGRALLEGQVAAIVDTGTTLIIGDPASVQDVYQNIPGSKDASSIFGPGFFTVPCDGIPAISLTFGGKAFSVSPTTFNVGVVSGNDCVGGLMSVDGLGFWVIGDVFLRNVYTAFDVGANTVGFASLA